MYEVEAKAKVLRALGISETRVSELLGTPDAYSLEITSPQKEISIGEPQGKDKQRQAAISTFPSARVGQRLQEALIEKEGELALHGSDLASSYYADDDWTRQQITYLQSHIAEIERYLREGGQLKLPRCCREPDYICLIAMRGFDACIMTPKECGFSLK